VKVMQEIDMTFETIDRVDLELTEKERELELIEQRLDKLLNY
jgi:hypothetical protein